MPPSFFLAQLLLLTPPTVGVVVLTYLLRRARSWGWRLFWLAGLVVAGEVGFLLAQAGWETWRYAATLPPWE